MGGTGSCGLAWPLHELAGLARALPRVGGANGGGHPGVPAVPGVARKNKRRFNELVLRVVLRLAAPADGNPNKAGVRQLELLSDLVQAIPANHRPDCLRWLDNACAEWIDAAMKKRVKPDSKDPLEAETEKYRPSTPMPVAELALLAALRLLGEQHGDQAAGHRFTRLSDSRAESTVQRFADRLREGKPLHESSAL